MELGKIYYLMGKSSTGKDTIYKEIKKIYTSLNQIILYTTRPIRDGEKDGIEYYFIDEEKFSKLNEMGKVIESRTYNTVFGPWTYATIDDDSIELTEKSYIGIGTLESYGQIRNYFGSDKVIPIYLEIEDGIRLMRAIKREMDQETPKYNELCRRFLADEEDFSTEKLRQCGIIDTYNNTSLDNCLAKIFEVIDANENP